MAVTRFEFTNREPYAGSKHFGDIGEYERIDGLVHYEVDPAHASNQDIIDLDLAPRDDNGMVRFFGDVCLLVPRDPSRGSRRLLLEVPNRGIKPIVTRTIHRAQTPKAGEIPAGDGFLFRHGYTVGWVGWQWDVYRSEALMGLVAPEAQNVSGTTRVRFQARDSERVHLLAHRNHQPLPAADPYEVNAAMYVRDWTFDKPRMVPREHWQFAIEDQGRVVADREYVYYEPGFEPGKIYEIVYTTNRAPVVGAGLLAIRDLASYLRYSDDDDNPCAGQLDYVYGTGRSQTGRVLRHFVYLGLNVDEEHRQVYDGLVALVAGARRGEFNHRFAQPSARDWPNFGHGCPFADEPMPNPDTEVVDGLLKRQREIGGVPKIFWMNSSSEYWRGDGALLHIDPTGSSDLEPAPETRLYSFPGTQHPVGDAPLVTEESQYGDTPRFPFNIVDYSPLMRNLYIRLHHWVSDDVEPPMSYHPRLDDQTAIRYEEYFAKFPNIPGIVYPAIERLRYLRRIDLGPRTDEGIGAYPPEIGEPYPAFVWDIDEDGNERGPVRLPDIDVPVGTHTAWNPRHPRIGAPEQVLLFTGATFYFPASEAERQRDGDPRRSIEERYTGRSEYLDAVRAAGRQLVEAGYVLAEDLELLVHDAAVRYDDARAQPHSMT